MKSRITSISNRDLLVKLLKEEKKIPPLLLELMMIIDREWLMDKYPEIVLKII